MSKGLMRVARLHGIRNLQVEQIPIPEPAPGQLLVKLEACGVCATDSRKYEIGVNDGEYPFNPGHEWVGRVSGVGDGVEGWKIGDRLYGDVYGGYAEYATIPVNAIPLVTRAFAHAGEIAVERAILVEPLADCLHAVHDQAKVGAGDRLVVIAAGVMGLKIVVEAARIGAKVLVVEPLETRRKLALDFGAECVIDATDWRQQVKEWSKAEEGGVHAVILTIGNPDLVNDCMAACRPGGRVVLFAGFGNRPQGMINLNDIHYREIVLVGSEWIGTPPNQVRKRYDLALDLLNDPNYPFEKLVTGTCGFEDVESALVQRQTFQGLKTMFVPRPA